MANKFEGDWHYYFVGLDPSGKSVIKDMGFFHVPKVENNGDLTDAKDDDGESLTGNLTNNNKTINLHRAAHPGPERHLKGDLIFDSTVGSVPWMIVVGERHPHPFAVPLKAEDLTAAIAAAVAQTDGTWVATKP